MPHLEVSVTHELVSAAAAADLALGTRFHGCFGDGRGCLFWDWRIIGFLRVSLGMG